MGAYENSVKLVKGGTVSGTNLSTAAALPSLLTNVTYGGSTNMWGLSLSYSDINASNFGAAFSAIGISTSNYIVGTNFGFSVPSTATIKGVQLDLKQSNVAGPVARVGAMKLTVFYTLPTVPSYSIIMFGNPFCVKICDWLWSSSRELILPRPTFATAR